MGSSTPRAQAEFERNVAAARGRLGEEGFNKAWEEGLAMDVGQAIELAKQMNTRLDEVGSPKAKGRPRKRAAGELTEREFDVAVRVARGMTNPEIAGELVLSVRTVEAHVANVMQKLGLHTRAELAAWAVREGIAAMRAERVHRGYLGFALIGAGCFGLIKLSNRPGVVKSIHEYKPPF